MSLKFFITDLFSEMSESGLTWCVLRNYETLPEEIGYDIDMLIQRGGFSLFEKLLKELSEKHRAYMGRQQNRYGFRSYYFHLNDGISPVVKLDIWDHIHWKGVPTACEQKILLSREMYRGFWVASKGAEGAVSLMKEFLQFNEVKDLGDGLHKAHYQKIIAEFPDDFKQTLSPIFGENMASKIQAVASQGQWSELEGFVGEIKKELLKRSISKNFMEQVKSWSLFVLGHIHDRVIRPSGISVCLIGPDGSGKTTASKDILKNLADLFNQKVYIHGHFLVIPELSRLKKIFKQPSQKEEIVDPDRPLRDMTEPNLLMTYIYIFYYSIDYIIGWFLICWKQKSKGGLVVFDRYYYDYFLNHRNRAIPISFHRVAMLFIPKPDILIWLKADAEQIANRKKELTVEETSYQLERCQKLIDLIGGEVVDATQGEEKTLKMVQDCLLRKLHQRHVAE